MNFSVLMSAYNKEQPQYLQQALESVMQQSTPPSEIVFIEDGILTPDLYAVCTAFKKQYPKIFRRIPLTKNVGLGRALQRGVLECCYSLIARMDTDDIAKPDRFKRQLAEFATDDALAMLGGWIEEFSGTPQEICSIRKVPLTHEEIVSFAKKRNPFNHMTVMFRKEAVLAAGNYQPMYLCEDYYLWFRMIQKHFAMRNVPEVLVSVRGNENMFQRRGGVRYFQEEMRLQEIFYRTGFITKSEYCRNLIVRFAARIMPNKMRGFAYRHFLRC